MLILITFFLIYIHIIVFHPILLDCCYCLKIRNILHIRWRCPYSSWTRARTCIVAYIRYFRILPRAKWWFRFSCTPSPRTLSPIILRYYTPNRSRSSRLDFSGMVNYIHDELFRVSARFSTMRLYISVRSCLTSTTLRVVLVVGRERERERIN